MAALAFLLMNRGLFASWIWMDWIGLDWIGLDVRVPYVLVYMWYLRHSRDIASQMIRFKMICQYACMHVLLRFRTLSYGISLPSLQRFLKYLSQPPPKIHPYEPHHHLPNLAPAQPPLTIRIPQSSHPVKGPDAPPAEPDPHDPKHDVDHIRHAESHIVAHQQLEDGFPVCADNGCVGLGQVHGGGVEI